MMQGEGQFNHTEGGGQMAAGPGNRLYYLFADVAGQLLEFSQ